MNNYQLMQGDCVEVLRTLPEKSVQCVVTSPPYFGLRDYGSATWDGGDPECDHAVGRFTTPVSEKQGSNRGSGTMHAKDVCPKCGARRADKQIGMEGSLQEYIDNLVAVFGEVWRVLRDDGVAWLNLGDSFNGSGGSGGDYNAGGLRDGQPRYPGRNISALKPKDLVGVPWRVAFALQDRGWYLRSDIVWAKGNPMPESVRDRPTRAHEYIFLLSKSRRYFYDHEAIKEPAKSTSVKKFTDGGKDKQRGHSRRHAGFNGRYAERVAETGPPKTANKRSVWTVNTRPYKGAHFAVFPQELIEPCILAGTSAHGCCSKCGAPWRRVMETTGWEPTCKCESSAVAPCTVLDPFAGSGTTLVVAMKHGRSSIGIELYQEYIELAEKRIAEVRKSPDLFSLLPDHP